MPNPDCDVTFGLCDPLNPGFGYRILVVDRFGTTRLHTATHPVTGRELDYAGCLEVAAWYAPGRPTPRPDLAGPVPPSATRPSSPPAACPVCGARPRTHACDEEACEPTPGSDPTASEGS